MEKLYYETIKETLYHEKMDNGLNVYLLPKYGFSKTYGLFSTRFGAIDTQFVPLGQSEMIKTQDGIAHFLEHKMFDMEDGDAGDKFSLLGASTNAFTSSSRTAYLFSSADRIDECVELLLDFVQSLHLTKESVEKEKGIIGQEISMYDDDPDWRNYFGSIASLYHRHPVKVDIAGTIETVNATTVEMLKECYETFYHPSNMMLFVVGNLEPEKMMALIRQNQAKKQFAPAQEIVRAKIEEPTSVYQKEEILKMDVVMPKLMMGIKINDIPQNGEDKLIKELSMNILLDILFSKSSPIYEEMQNNGLINDSFGAGFTQERDYAFIQVGGDTTKPEELKQYLFQLFDHLNEFNIDQATFERVKKKSIGIFINSFNSPDTIANTFSRYYFEGIFSFEIIDIISSITLSDVLKMREYFMADTKTVHIIVPQKDGTDN